jgi:hypothetical protein
MIPVAAFGALASGTSISQTETVLERSNYSFRIYVTTDRPAPLQGSLSSWLSRLAVVGVLSARQSSITNK